MIETVPSRLKIINLLAARFFSNGHLDDCLAIANTEGRYGRGLVRKKDKGGMAEVGRKCFESMSRPIPL